MSTWIIEDGVLCHHGVKGQKWGVRRYQNEDGSLKVNAQGRYSESRIASNRARLSAGRSEIRKNKALRKEMRDAMIAQGSSKREANRATKGYSHAKAALQKTGTIAARLLGHGAKALAGTALTAGAFSIGYLAVSKAMGYGGSIQSMISDFNRGSTLSPRFLTGARNLAVAGGVVSGLAGTKKTVKKVVSQTKETKRANRAVDRNYGSSVNKNLSDAIDDRLRRRGYSGTVYRK